MLQDASGDLFFCCHYATAVLFPRVRFVHLTNVAMKKNGEGYNKTHGGKWRLKHLRLWVQGIYGQAAADKLFRDMCVVFDQRTYKPTEKTSSARVSARFLLTRIERWVYVNTSVIY